MLDRFRERLLATPEERARPTRCCKKASIAKRYRRFEAGGLAQTLTMTLVSRTRPARQALGASTWRRTRRDGLGRAKAKEVVRDEAEIHLHTGGRYEWDSFAPVAVAAAAGLHVIRVDRSPLVCNRENTYLPDLLIYRAELGRRVLNLVKAMSA